RHSVTAESAQDVERLGHAIEFHGNSTIAPGVFKHVAAVRGQREVEAETARSVGEDADLVAGGGREKEEMLRHCFYCQAIVVYVKALVKSRREPGLWLEDVEV